MKGRVENCVQFYRKKVGMTQAELANKIGVSRQTVISIERGDYMPSIYLGIKISDALGKKVENVFTCIDE